jgi:ligand-binding sensor domain-containing protein
MSNKTFITVFAVFLFLVNISYPQSKKGWNVYTSFKDVSGIGISGNKVWAATTGGMFSFDYDSPASTTNKYTSLQGLLSNELSSLIVDNSGNVWTGGLDGSVNVFNPLSGVMKIIPDILNSTETSKGINDFFQYGNYMFISNEFSLIKYDINRFEFVDQPYIYLGPLIPVKSPVFKTIVVNDTVWAATKYGIAFANINSYLPIQSSWSNYTTGNSVMLKNKTNTVAYFNRKVYFGTDSGMVYRSGSGLSRFAPLYNGSPVTDAVSHMTVSNGNLYFSTFTTSNNVFKVNVSNSNLAVLVYSGVEVNSLTVNPAGDLLIGTSNKGVIIYKNNTVTYVKPNAPNSNLFLYVAADINQNVWGVSGGINEGIFRYNGSTWKNFTTDEYPQMRGNDFRQVYGSRNSSTVWASGYGEGLLKIMGDSVYLFNDENSILKSFFTPGFVLVEGVKEDNLGNLWVLNRATEKPFVNFTQSLAYPVPEVPTQNSVIFLAIDNYNTKWATYPSDVEGSERGVVYLNEVANSGKILRAPVLGSDITTANGIAVDKNGEVWIATDNGVAIIRDPYQVIQNPNSTPFIEKMRIIENGISTPLTENVQSICVDALNNKWLGTLSSGVIYVSPDGSTILKEFNTSNSPITDNRISSIAADPKSGKVYFGTQKGLSSYQTVAIDPLTDCDKITAGPSPFVIPNDNLLRIDGLVEGSSVKILTISGMLVAEFDSPGGRVANWDGRDLNGSYVSSGIYIIVGYNQDGSKVCTGKVAVVRK